MGIHAIYENGIIRPLEKLDLKNHQKIIIYFREDNEKQDDLELAEAYREASLYNNELADWNLIETEDWPD